MESGLPNATNLWSAILSASNGLTWNRATRSLTWGGSLTANTTIELGASRVEFTQSGAPVLVVTNGQRIGIRTASPATQVNTASSTANQTDGTTALGTLGFGYEAAQAAFIGAFVNTNNATSSNGVLFRIARTNADSFIARFVSGGSLANGLSIRGNSQVVMGPYTTNVNADFKGYVKGSFIVKPTNYDETGATIGASGSDYATFSYNVLFTNTPNSFLREGADSASMLYMGGASALSPFKIRLAPSGAAGSAITFTDVFTSYIRAGVPYMSFFPGVTPVVRQTGGALTAGAAYGANEQTMLNAIWAALRNYGLLT